MYDGKWALNYRFINSARVDVFKKVQLKFFSCICQNLLIYFLIICHFDWLRSTFNFEEMRFPYDNDRPTETVYR